MTMCSIRYYRPSRREDAGLLMVKKSELGAYRARLEASGYIVLDDPVAIPPEAFKGKLP